MVLQLTKTESSRLTREITYYILGATVNEQEFLLGSNIFCALDYIVPGTVQAPI